MNILLATDGSDSASAAVDFLLRFPFPEQSTVTLLTVVDERVFIDIDAYELSDDQHLLLQEMTAAAREDARRMLDGHAERVAERGWTVNTRVASGYVAEEILAVEQELQADLIIVGSHGTSGYRRFMLGSVATKLLDYAASSVLIVKQPAEAAPVDDDWRILLAYDGSAPANQAVAQCASLPLGERDVVTVLTVITLITAFRQDIRQQLNPIWQQKKAAAKAAHEAAVARLHGSLSNVNSRLREGDNSAHEVIEEATESGANLIMLGSKGKKAIQRFLLGSMTSHVARHAPCSVWVIRESDQSPRE